MTEEKISHGNKVETYEEFVDKFKPKHTTDECYTPPEVYEIVKSFFMKKFNIDENTEIVRPFYSGGDYQNYKYNDGCVVIDNPPFSILKSITRWYNDHGIKFVLFCQSNTAFELLRNSKNIGLVFSCYPIEYENGANVNTSFVHNFNNKVESSAELNILLKATKKKKAKPSYQYPANVVTFGTMGKLVKRGYSVEISNYYFTSRLDVQKRNGIFGGGILVSDEYAAIIENMINQPIDKHIDKHKIAFILSEREKNIVKELSETM